MFRTPNFTRYHIALAIAGLVLHVARYKMDGPSHHNNHSDSNARSSMRILISTPPSLDGLKAKKKIYEHIHRISDGQVISPTVFPDRAYRFQGFSQQQYGDQKAFIIARLSFQKLTQVSWRETIITQKNCKNIVPMPWVEKRIWVSFGSNRHL